MRGEKKNAQYKKKILARINKITKPTRMYMVQAAVSTLRRLIPTETSLMSVWVKQNGKKKKSVVDLIWNIESW